MRVRFWGTRGSLASPGAHTCRYGGNTACVSVETASGEFLILDCGTGARALGAHMLAAAPRPVRASILLSHTHWDHIQGFPFFAPVFVPGNRFDVYAPEGGMLSLEETLAGQMEYTYFPIALRQLPSDIVYHELGEGAFPIGGTRIETQYLNHPAMTLGYRIECDGVWVVYLSDHEPFAGELWRSGLPPGNLESILHEGDRRHASFMAGADLVIHDAQYTPGEAPSKRNWGHSSYDYVVELAAAAGVRRLALTHHDPARTDAGLDEIAGQARALARARNPRLEVFAAAEGSDIALAPARHPHRPERPEGIAHPATSCQSRRVLLISNDAETIRSIREAFARDPLLLTEASSWDAASGIIERGEPDLLMVDLDSGVTLPSAGAALASAELPVLLLAGQSLTALQDAGVDPASADYLAKPFSIPQIRARARASLARGARRKERTQRSGISNPGQGTTVDGV